MKGSIIKYYYYAIPRQLRNKLLFEQAQKLATQWLWTYNNERHHTAIGGVPPRQLLQAA
nr:integrase core domain-containing protein [Thiopseudomonas alkaliphila]